MTSGLPLRLAAPAPTWERDVDVVVLGSGAAGLAAALAVRPVRQRPDRHQGHARRRLDGVGPGRPGRRARPRPTRSRTTCATRSPPAPGCATRASCASSSPRRPKAIRYLMRLGAAFDPAGDDATGPALTREGGHSHNRIVHAGGDRSGAEVQRTLDESAMAAGVEVLDRAFALDLVVGTSPDGARQAAGVRVALLDADDGVASVGTICGPGRRPRHRRLRARSSPRPRTRRRSPATVWRWRCAPGWPSATSSSCSSTRPCCGPGPTRSASRRWSARRCAARARSSSTRAGDRVMDGVHPLEDLAPRDVVAAAISRRMAAGAGRRRRPRVPRRHQPRRALLRALPDDHRGLPSDRHRPGPRSHPGRPRRPLRVRRRAGPPRRRHRAAAGSTPSARCACTGVHGANRLASQQPHRGGRRRHPARARPGLGAARPRRGRNRRPRARRRPDRRRPPRRGPGGDVAPRRRAPRRRRRSRPRPPPLDAVIGHGAATGVDADAAAFEATNLLDRGAGRRRCRGGAHREPRLSPPHRLPRPARRVAPPPRRHARRRRRRPVLVRRDATPAVIAGSG